MFLLHSFYSYLSGFQFLPLAFVVLLPAAFLPFVGRAPSFHQSGTLAQLLPHLCQTPARWFLRVWQAKIKAERLERWPAFPGFSLPCLCHFLPPPSVRLWFNPGNSLSSFSVQCSPAPLSALCVIAVFNPARVQRSGKLLSWLLWQNGGRRLPLSCCF